MKITHTHSWPKPLVILLFRKHTQPSSTLKVDPRGIGLILSLVRDVGCLLHITWTPHSTTHHYSITPVIISISHWTISFFFVFVSFHIMCVSCPAPTNICRHFFHSRFSSWSNRFSSFLVTAQFLLYFFVQSRRVKEIEIKTRPSSRPPFLSPPPLSPLPLIPFPVKISIRLKNVLFLSSPLTTMSRRRKGSRPAHQKSNWFPGRSFWRTEFYAKTFEKFQLGSNETKTGLILKGDVPTFVSVCWFRKGEKCRYNDLKKEFIFENRKVTHWQ